MTNHAIASSPSLMGQGLTSKTASSLKWLSPFPKFNIL